MVRKIIKCPPIIMPIILLNQLTLTILISILLNEVFHNPLICVALAIPVILFNLFILVNFIHYYDIIASHLDPITTFVEAKLNGKEICPKCNKTILDEKTFWLSNCTGDFCALEGKPLIIRALLWHVWF